MCNNLNQTKYIEINNTMNTNTTLRCSYKYDMAHEIKVY